MLIPTNAKLRRDIRQSFISQAYACVVPAIMLALATWALQQPLDVFIVIIIASAAVSTFCSYKTFNSAAKWRASVRELIEMKKVLGED